MKQYFSTGDDCAPTKGQQNIVILFVIIIIIICHYYYYYCHNDGEDIVPLIVSG